MIKLMDNIKKMLDKTTIRHYEIYCFPEYSNEVYINLYYEDINTAEKINKELLKKFPEYIIEHEVYTPSKETVLYGFSGHPFSGIVYTIDQDKIEVLDEEHIICDVNEMI